MQVQMALFHYVLWLSNVPFYTHTYTHTYVSHIFFIHSSVDGHLCCFHVLTIVNSTAEHGDACIFSNCSFVQIYAQGQSCQITWKLFFQFFEEPLCSSKWLSQFIFPPTVQEDSLFFTPSPAFVICRAFKDGHSDWLRCYLMVVLLCISLIINYVEHLFLYLLPICISSLENVSLGLPLILLGCLVFCY